MNMPLGKSTKMVYNRNTEPFIGSNIEKETY